MKLHTSNTWWLIVGSLFVLSIVFGAGYELGRWQAWRLVIKELSANQPQASTAPTAEVKLSNPIVSSDENCRQLEVTQRYSFYHKAIDLSADQPCTIKSAGEGVVEVAGWDDSGYGNRIIIDHGNGLRTLYAHGQTPFLVKPGQKVIMGQPLFEMSSTGRTTGQKLHFEVRLRGELKDPEEYISFPIDPNQVKG